MYTVLRQRKFRRSASSKADRRSIRSSNLILAFFSFRSCEHCLGYPVTREIYFGAFLAVMRIESDRSRGILRNHPLKKTKLLLRGEATLYTMSGFRADLTKQFRASIRPLERESPASSHFRSPETCECPILDWLRHTRARKARALRPRISPSSSLVGYQGRSQGLQREKPCKVESTNKRYACTWTLSRGVDSFLALVADYLHAIPSRMVLNSPRWRTPW